ncbi:hypothetical protein [Suttonella ornithocola]|uniref:Uncharacterized protein n=1 Tax=Suttonella ornithocola TaxID=279832 RepID=A0A380MX40_9GAMM|nr:hypothetical protein [Suttonella ornithocola]SUO96744.1 Uncharacterised protein [Suttonella ornithocola]
MKIKFFIKKVFLRLFLSNSERKMLKQGLSVYWDCVSECNYSLREELDDILSFGDDLSLEQRSQEAIELRQSIIELEQKREAISTLDSSL